MDRIRNGVGRLGSAALGLLLGAPFYLVLVDTTTTPELIALGCSALLAAGAYQLAYAEGAGHGSYRARWLRRLWFVLAQVPKQIAVVCAEVLTQTLAPRPERGRLRVIEFEVGDDLNPHEIGRAVLAQALGSLAPNTIVIGVDAERKLLLAHQLRPDSGATSLDPLRLRAAAGED